MSYIDLTKDNIENEHICCAISDRKCTDGYKMKKEWLTDQFSGGYVFRRLDERAKVFLEYGPAEEAWMPVSAPEYLVLGCFWVSGKYKKTGHGKALLRSATDDARKKGKRGLVAVAGARKNHFMSDGKWLKKQGFQVCDTTPDGFELLYRNLDGQNDSELPVFLPSAREGGCKDKEGLVIYYSNRCPFTEFHVRISLKETAEKRGLDLKVIKLESREDARSCPSPATIFTLYKDGEFVTTDLSVCMDSRFDKIMKL